MQTGKILLLVIGLVIGMLCLPLVLSAADSIMGEEGYTEAHTAVEILATEEVIDLDYAPTAGTTVVEVNGVGTLLFAVVGNVLTIEAGECETGDLIEVEYDYERDLPTGMGVIIPMIPVFYVLFLLGIAAAGLRSLF